MKVSLSFEFDSIEEMHSVSSKLAGVETVSTPASGVAEKTKTTRASAKTNKPDVSPPADTVANPFAGADMGQSAQQPSANTFNRDAILAEATKFITDFQAKGLPIGKLAEIINTHYFLPRNIPQTSARNLNDHQLADFANELRVTFIQKANEALSGASLV